jgi:predicted Rossmann-fold nucleotide-binding protein
LQNRLVQEIHDLASLERALADSRPLNDLIVCGLDLRRHGAMLTAHNLRGVVLLGCELEPGDLVRVVESGATIFPAIRGLPYSPWRTMLYTPDELFGELDAEDRCTYCNTLDARIYRHFRQTASTGEPPMLEALAQRLHDHGITQALELLLREHERVVAIMGGHGLSRADRVYLEVAQMAGELAGRGYLVATGGGPGAMEAANLGARFAGRDEAALRDAVRILARAPTYKDRDWLVEAAAVRREHAALMESPPIPTLGVPTFFYGHEPPNMFATHHAKYFANCVREEGLVSIATHGILFAPGSAGTVQEIFQDACQNHYGTIKGLVSPMALLGTRYWNEQLPVVPLLDALSRGNWSDRVLVSDDPAQLVSFLVEHGPRVLDRAAWSFCTAYCA